MYSRDSGYSKGKALVKKVEKAGMIKGVYFVIAPVIMVSLVLCACTATGAQQPASPALQDNTSTAANTPAINPAPTVPSIPVTPESPKNPAIPATPAASTPTQSGLPPPPSIAQLAKIDTPAAENLIRTEANLMTLTLDDMGPGWMKGNPVSPSRQDVISASSVHYYKGTSFSSVVQNTIGVYRSMDAAIRAYAKEEANQSAVTHPAFGNECFLNDSVAINKLLVFRKANVVSWLWLQNDKKGDVEPYAKIVASKIVQ
jgi:hypothetical protein